MAVPSDVEATSEVFEATGLWVDESFRLGRYSVAGVDRASTKSSAKMQEAGFFFDAAVDEETQGGYTYRFLEGEQELRAACRTFTNRKKSIIGTLEQTTQASRLACSCENGDRASSVEVAWSGRQPSGTATLAGEALVLTSLRVSGPAWAPAEAMGFLVDAADGPIAAVEVVRPGRMWLSRELGATEQRELGCLLAGLMLHVED